MQTDKGHERVSVIIPALNEQDSIGLVIRDIPQNLVDEIIVVDNGSIDNTFQAAQDAGARVVREDSTGYGAACLKGIASAGDPDIYVFLDGDYSDYPEEVEYVIAPLLKEEADLVIGTRISLRHNKGVLPVHAFWGNRLATLLIRMLYHYRFTDLGPFRAIRSRALKRMKMKEKTFGWTVEMQVKAAKLGLKAVEVPVNYRKRIGRSKVSGTLLGSVKAGAKILFTIFRLRLYSAESLQ